MLTPWKKLGEEVVGHGFRTIVRRSFQLPNGTIADFDVKYEAHQVSVLALTARRQVILAKQFRPGPEAILMDLPGGSVNPTEMPEQAIKRELLEETGYTGQFQFVSQNFHCAYSTVIRYNFVATTCYKIAEPEPDAEEFIEVVELPLDDFQAHLKSGRLTNIEAAYSGLTYLGLW